MQFEEKHMDLEYCMSLMSASASGVQPVMSHPGDCKTGILSKPILEVLHLGSHLPAPSLVT